MSTASRMRWALGLALSVVLLVALGSGGCTLTRSGRLDQTCTSAAECALPNPCYVAECSSVGQCVFTATDNTAALEQTPNDCALYACVVDGDVAEPLKLPAPDDRPADVACQKKYTCADGELSESGVAPGAICGSDGQGQCQNGACVVGCDAIGDPRCNDDNACTNDVCNLNTNECEHETLDNIDAPGQVEGDCRVVLCVLGNQSEIYDDLDVYDDGSECTTDTCNQGQPVNTPIAAGTTCSGDDPLASVCDSLGGCVQCNADAECVGFMTGWDDTDCQTPRCVAGTCELACEPLGTIAAVQSGQPDCQTSVCDGSCGYVDQVDDSDVPDDNNDCTVDFCDLGSIEHPPEPLNTACGAGGLCDGNGNCGACNSDTDCQADTFCRDWHCDTTQNPNLCVFTDINEGVDLPTGQNDGDCHTVRCNTGLSDDQIDDADVPVDPFQCTFDVCTAGVPTNPPLDIDEICTDSGGRFCDGNGACVDCNDVSQCTGADGICDFDACQANTCVIAFEDVNTNAPMSCQSGSPDCQVVKCDGAGDCGASVPDDADVVDDGVECTLDSCSAGAEVHDAVAVEGATCTQNAAFCDGPETCQTGACLPSGNPCAGQDVGPDCNDSCDEGADACTANDAAATSCNDGSFCNGADTCDGLGACLNTGTNPCPGQDAPPLCDDSCQELGAGAGDCTGPDASTTSCDDGTFCNGSELCDGAGTCASSGNPCPGQDAGPDCADSCNEAAGDCTGFDSSATTCDDGTFCNGSELCDGAGTCASSGNPCPGQDTGPDCADSCNEGAGDCTAFDSSATSCDDGTFCNGSELCDGAGTCASSGNPCPGQDSGPDCADSCNEGAGDCTGFDSSATTCDDGTFCNGSELCDGAGMCASSGDPCDGPDGDAMCAESCDETGDACTLADPNGSDCGAGNVCIAATCSDVRLVFVTSTLYDGDDLGSAAAADAECAARASAGGLPGTFMAWMSDATTSPVSRFNAAVVPYVLLDGTQIAADFADLTSGTIASAIAVDELGLAVGTEAVWTGTLEDGTADATHCASWTSSDAADDGLAGSTNRTNARWSNEATSTCDATLRLYCFEQ